jgi:hypothetical protein
MTRSQPESSPTFCTCPTALPTSKTLLLFPQPTRPSSKAGILNGAGRSSSTRSRMGRRKRWGLLRSRGPPRRMSSGETWCSSRSSRERAIIRSKRSSVGKVDSDSVSTDGECRLTFAEGFARFEFPCLICNIGQNRFHRPIEGEEGYEKQDATVLKQKHSSLAQIVSTTPRIEP